MTNRERLLAIMNYQPVDRIPAVHFGFTPEVIEKWVLEGHLDKSLLSYPDYDYTMEKIIADKLGFDFGWNPVRLTTMELFPFFKRQFIEYLEDGFEKHLNEDGVYILQKPGTSSIPSEIDHLLKDRESWENIYLPRLTYSEERYREQRLELAKQEQALGNPVGLHCGSIIGRVRDYLGIVGLSYLTVDDEELLCEMIDTIGDLCYQSTVRSLESGLSFDYAHFWEDMCYKNGPLISPVMFEEYTAHHYKKITDLLHEHDIDIISVDCDGMIDRFIPTWLDNGVNTMFPIEVGTWDASLLPWRDTYGKELKGIGGMRKELFSKDTDTLDTEIKRLHELAKLGGYIPCPDHRIPQSAIWENVQYYCQKLKELTI